MPRRAAVSARRQPRRRRTRAIFVRRLRSRRWSGVAPRRGVVHWELSDEDYRAKVQRALEYLRAGDCYQINLSHRLRATLGEHDALPLYLRLRELAPTPLGAYLATESATLLANTPEL